MVNSLIKFFEVSHKILIVWHFSGKKVYNEKKTSNLKINIESECLEIHTFLIEIII